MKLFYTLSAVLFAAAPASAGLSLSVRDLKLKLRHTRLMGRRRPRPGFTPHALAAAGWLAGSLAGMLCLLGGGGL